MAKVSPYKKARHSASEVTLASELTRAIESEAVVSFDIPGESRAVKSDQLDLHDFAHVSDKTSDDRDENFNPSLADILAPSPPPPVSNFGPGQRSPELHHPSKLGNEVKPVQFEETRFYRDYVMSTPAHRHLRHKNVIIVINRSFLAKTESWRDSGAESELFASAETSKAARACIGFNNFDAALEFLVNFFDHSETLRVSFIVYPGIHDLPSLRVLHCFSRGFEVDIIGSICHSPPNPPIDVTVGRNRTKTVCLTLGEEMLSEDMSLDEASTATKSHFLPQTGGGLKLSLCFSYVVAEFGGHTVFKSPFAASVDDPNLFSGTIATDIAFASCTIQTALDRTLRPALSFANVHLDMTKCKIRLGTWFVEGVVGNQVPVTIDCEAVAADIHHCDLVEGKIKCSARSRLAMDDCWSLCFPLQMSGGSTADVRSSQFVNAGDIRFQGSRDAITSHKGSAATVTECQFEAFGIALCAKHRRTSVVAVRNVFKSCNTVALASMLSRVEMSENEGKGSKCLLVAVEKATSKLSGNKGDFTSEDLVQVDEDTEDPEGDVEEVTVIARRPRVKRQTSGLNSSRVCAHCSVAEKAMTCEELRLRNGFLPETEMSPDQFFSCPICPEAFYCSSVCQTEDIDDHAFVCHKK